MPVAGVATGRSLAPYLPEAGTGGMFRRCHRIPPSPSLTANRTMSSSAPPPSAFPAPARSFEFSATRRIAAPAEAVYAVFADYRVAHPAILPPRFFTGLEVVEGGRGAGTVVRVEGRFAGRTRAMTGYVTEPEPGRVLVESYPEDRVVTSFRVQPAGAAASNVTISSVFPRRRGPAGWVQERLVRRLLIGVYAEELDRTEAYLAGRAGAGGTPG